jgi:hypothetical protein
MDQMQECRMAITECEGQIIAVALDDDDIARSTVDSFDEDRAAMDSAPRWSVQVEQDNGSTLVKLAVIAGVFALSLASVWVLSR